MKKRIKFTFAIIFGLYAVVEGILFFEGIFAGRDAAPVKTHLTQTCFWAGISFILFYLYKQDKTQKNVQIVSEDEFKRRRDKAKRMAIFLAIGITILFPLLFLYSYYIKHDNLVLSLVPALLTMVIGYSYAGFMYYKCGVE
jgi:arginine exporter protein ArgO